MAAWSEGRTGSRKASEAKERQHNSALEDVDKLLLALAKDELVQQDLLHPDVRRAFAHWTDNERLERDEAERLMDDNFRVQAVFERIRPLQVLCRQAGIALPLQALLEGKGLSRGDEAAPVEGQGSRATGGLAEPERVLPSDGHAGPALTAPGAGKGRWWDVLMGEVARAALVAVVALVFSLVLKWHRGDNPLDHWAAQHVAGGGAGSGSGMDASAADGAEHAQWP